MRDFFANPWRQCNGMISGRKFDFGHDQAFVLAFEFIDLPDKAAERHLVAQLLDDARQTKGVEQLLRFSLWYFVFVFIARDAVFAGGALDRQEAFVACDT